MKQPAAKENWRDVGISCVASASATRCMPRAGGDLTSWQPDLNSPSIAHRFLRQPAKAAQALVFGRWGHTGAAVAIVLGLLVYAAVWANTALLYGWVSVWQGRREPAAFDPRLNWELVLRTSHVSSLTYVRAARERLLPFPHMELLVAREACNDRTALESLVRVAYISGAKVVLEPGSTCTTDRITLPGRHIF